MDCLAGGALASTRNDSSRSKNTAGFLVTTTKDGFVVGYFHYLQHRPLSILNSTCRQTTGFEVEEEALARRPNSCMY
jgi:hypothetical protein